MIFIRFLIKLNIEILHSQKYRYREEYRFPKPNSNWNLDSHLTHFIFKKLNKFINTSVVDVPISKYGGGQGVETSSYSLEQCAGWQRGHNSAHNRQHILGVICLCFKVKKSVILGDGNKM